MYPAVGLSLVFKVFLYEVFAIGYILQALVFVIVVIFLVVAEFKPKHVDPITDSMHV